RECGMMSDRLPQVGNRGAVRLDADDPLRHLDEDPGGGPDARADFEHARADVGTKKRKHVALVAPRLAHGREIVGSKAHLGLNVATVDMHRFAGRCKTSKRYHRVKTSLKSQLSIRSTVISAGFCGRPDGVADWLRNAAADRTTRASEVATTHARRSHN